MDAKHRPGLVWSGGLVLALLLAALGPVQASSPRVAARAETAGMALSSLLNADDTLDISSGYSGSVDPRDWSMEAGPKGEPHFVVVNSTVPGKSGTVPVSGEKRQPAGAEPQVQGDENWDDRFGLAGVNGDVSAIAVSGSDVYVGGEFSTAGGASANNIARWNGSSWSALASGVNALVDAIAISGSDDNVNLKLRGESII